MEEKAIPGLDGQASPAAPKTASVRPLIRPAAKAQISLKNAGIFGQFGKSLTGR